jgi:hypothetical protein
MDTETSDSAITQWRFSGRAAWLVQLLAILVAFLALPGFAWVGDILHPGITFSITVKPGQSFVPVVMFVGVMLGTLMLMALLLAIHEFCHGLAFRRQGVKPRYGARMMASCLPVIYAHGPGRWFTKGQYTAILLAPTLVVNTLGFLLLWALGSLNWIMVFPLAIHLGCCAGDWWMAVAVARLPSGVRIEDTLNGFQYRIERQQVAESRPGE